MNRRNFIKLVGKSIIALPFIGIISSSWKNLEVEKDDDLGGYLVPEQYTNELLAKLKFQEFIQSSHEIDNDVIISLRNKI